MIRRTEIANNTQEQVREYVAGAVDVANDLAPEGSACWAAVFRAAYDGLAGKQIMLEQPQPLDLSPLRNNIRRQ